ncbi:D-glucuronyl C5-epimerase family protein [Arsenicicoccus dermatophilus]|uniref:D-glucuronyl C5-epimerase family protein n=1 Tax=Arsenicicoccus dermatophilus TaxID=1076331 RepID=UPI0039170333
MSPRTASTPTRRSVLRAGLGLPLLMDIGRDRGTGDLAGPGRLAWDPPGAVWRTKAYDHDLRAGSPFFATYTRPYPLDLGLAPFGSVEGLVLQGGTVRCRIAGRYQPQMTTTAWYLLPQIWSYRLDRDPRRLDRILRTMSHAASLTLADHVTGATWWVHRGDYKAGELGLDPRGWVSGMTQGMALSVLAALWETTGGQEWRALLDSTFRSYRHTRSVSSAALTSPYFVVHARAEDGSTDTYFEEYPSPFRSRVAHVVNGFVYSIWGVLDYYRVSRDPEALVLLDRSLATLEASFRRYRQPGEASWYAMTDWGHEAWGQPESYHRGTASILQTTGRFCGDSALIAQGLTLLRDHSGVRPAGGQIPVERPPVPRRTRRTQHVPDPNSRPGTEPPPTPTPRPTSRPAPERRPTPKPTPRPEPTPRPTPKPTPRPEPRPGLRPTPSPTRSSPRPE